jgi:lipoprotein-anchoring transpeptidase ErfK/SrfK
MTPRTSRPAARHGVLAVGLATIAVLALTPAGTRAASSEVPKVGELVVLNAPKQATAKPVFGSRTTSAVPDQRPITLTTTTLPVLDQKTDEGGRVWLKVRLPGREMHRKTPPRTGWITASYTKLKTTPWHLVINVATRRVHVYRNGRRVKTFSAVVGKPSTPTPRGEFFIEETMRLPRAHVGAPYALATSARSPTMREFMGGPAQIALHGIVNVGGKLGTAVSNGCIRMTTSAITWLAKHIKAGTPLTIK